MRHSLSSSERPPSQKPMHESQAPPRPLGMLSQLASLAAVSAILHAIGFVTTRTFLVTLGLPDEYFPESPSTYLLWGAKAVAAISFFLSLPVIPLALVITMVAPLVSPPIAAAARTLIRLPKTLLSILVFVVALLPLGIAAIGFREILVVGLGFFDDPVPPLSTLEVFAPAHVFAHAGYLILFAGAMVLVLVLAHTMSRQLRAGSWPKMQCLALLVALVAIAVLYLQLLAGPYRLMFHNKFEKTCYADTLAFIMARRDSTIVLYMPDYESRIIASSDSLLVYPTPRQYECVFEDSTATRACPRRPLDAVPH